MNPEQQIRKEHSRRNTDLIVNWIGHDKKRFEKVFSLMKSNELKLVQRSSWVVKNALISNPVWINSYAKNMLRIMDKDKQHEGVVRHMLSVFDEGIIPEKLESAITERCFSLFMNASSAIAVRVISMSILTKMAILYGDLRNELIGLIELELEKGAGPAMQSRAKKCLKTLKNKGF